MIETRGTVPDLPKQAHRRSLSQNTDTLDDNSINCMNADDICCRRTTTADSGNE